MKTPGEIIIGLQCMSNSDIECNVCPYRDSKTLFCSTEIVRDAVACIHRLEADLKIAEIKLQAAFGKAEQLQIERDQAVKDLRELNNAPDNMYGGCFACKWRNKYGGCKKNREYPSCNWENDKWEWRGVVDGGDTQ